MSENGITIFLSLAIFVALVVMFIRKNRDKANADPQAVMNVLKELGSDYDIVTDVVVPGDRGMFDLGNVLISPYGVFVITVKRNRGKILGREGDREWEVKSGRQKDLIFNPLWENRKHVNALEKVIGPTPFISVVVFPSGKLKGDFGENVMGLGGLKNFIAQNKTSRLSKDRRDEIIKALQKR
ncbi:MAG: nuclease-related domain-containing protein [Nitrospinota bacterium]